MVDKRTVRRGYDGVASAFAARRSFDSQEQRVLERFLEGLPSDPRVLDAGCGGGVPVLGALSEANPDATPIGLDLSGTQLDRAADAAPEAALIQGDLTRLPLDDASVDAVAAFHSLVHVPAAEHRAAIAEFARVVRPGGRVLLSEGTEQWDGANPDWLDAGVEMQWYIAGAPATRRQLEAAGLTIENEWPVEDVLVEGESWVFFDARRPESSTHD